MNMLELARSTIQEHFIDAYCTEAIDDVISSTEQYTHFNIAYCNFKYCNILPYCNMICKFEVLFFYGISWLQM